VNKHIPERSHILERFQMLARDDVVFPENLENIPVSLRFAPPMERHEMVADIDDFLDAQLEISLDEGPEPEVFVIFLPGDVIGIPQGSQVFPELRYLTGEEFPVNHSALRLSSLRTPNFPKQTAGVQICGTRPHFLPDTLGRIVFPNEQAIFEDLVLEQRRGLIKDDQIHIPTETAGQIRLHPETFAAWDWLLRNDCQIEIAAAAIPPHRRGPEQIRGRYPLPSPEQCCQLGRQIADWGIHLGVSTFWGSGL